MIFAKKSLGQNFLQSDKALRQIAEASGLTQDEIGIEIGPGEGALTEKLLATGATIFAIEKDDRLIPILQQKYSEQIKNGKLILVHDDILKVDIQKLVGDRKYKLIANIPYYITGMIMEMFLGADHKPEQIVLLVQKEVAERITTKDGKESILSMSVKLYGTPRIIDRVPRGAFRPIPNVDSAIILINDIHKNNITKEIEEKFFLTLKKAFGQRRKQIGNTLGVTDEQVKSVNQNLSTKSRPEELSVSDWLALSDILN